MRKALIVGIDYYQNFNLLKGCVSDAYSVGATLARHDGGLSNFGCKVITGTGPNKQANRAEIMDAIEELFSDDPEIALFYFAGHGSLTSTGGYLATSESSRPDDGIALNQVIKLANESKARNKIIILDSCQSGIAGNPLQDDQSILSEGVTILTASTKDQYASEVNGSGLFTNLLVDALNGSAANLMGDVTPGSVYAHIDQSLGEWDQRPVFKTNVKEFVSLRKTAPSISHQDLIQISRLFPEPGFEFQLDPTFEPERHPQEKNLSEPIAENVDKFKILQKYNRLNLLVPLDAPHMWHAAMQSKSCKLTALGEHYRRLAANKNI